MALPCDALCPRPGVRADRAISIAAPAPIVFAWLCQLRIAPYSYDLLDNFGRRSPRHRNPDLVHLEVGQRFMTLFALESFVADEQITLLAKGTAVTYAVGPDAVFQSTIEQIPVVFCKRVRDYGPQKVPKYNSHQRLSDPCDSRGNRPNNN